MDIISLQFIIFTVVGLALYYICKDKYKWICLLLISAVFYCMADVRNIIFILLESLIIYVVGKSIKRIYGNDSLKKKEKLKKGKKILIVGIVLIVSLLFITKYIPVLIPINELIQSEWTLFQWIMPIGISYYSLMAISYICDVYWNKCECENNYFKLMLYIGYFPQLVQGPVSKFSELSKQFFDAHPLAWENIKRGVQLIIWGYFKKMVISDRISAFVNSVFYTDESSYGLNVFIGLVCFGIRLYGDFSGGIDVIRGVSECFGISLMDNFNQPFFSKSLGEFWRRWHISLGKWMSEYVFYPFALSGFCRKLKSKLKKPLGRQYSGRVTFALSYLLTFFLVGLWHSLGSKDIAWGLYNGLILAFSSIAVDWYENGKKKLKINAESPLWNLFCIGRTFIIVTIGWIFDCSGSAGEAFQLFINMFKLSGTNLGVFKDIGTVNILIIAVSCLILFCVSLYREKHGSFRDFINSKNYFVQIIFWVIIIQMIICFGREANAGEFIYANF